MLPEGNTVKTDNANTQEVFHYYYSMIIYINRIYQRIGNFECTYKNKRSL